MTTPDTDYRLALWTAAFLAGFMLTTLIWAVTR